MAVDIEKAARETFGGGDDSRENREWVPLASKIRAIIETDIESERQAAADKFIDLQQKQIDSRKKIFGAISVDMPLPSISREEYLLKYIPMDAWLYSQYGVLLDIAEDGKTMISADGMDIIKKLKIDKMTLYEINGAPRTPKEETTMKIEEKYGPKEATPKRKTEKKQEITNKKIHERQQQEQNRDILRDRRIYFEKLKREERKKKMKKILIWTGAIGGPILLMFITIYVIMRVLFMR